MHEATPSSRRSYRGGGGARFVWALLLPMAASGPGCSLVFGLDDLQGGASTGAGGGASSSTTGSTSSSTSASSTTGVTSTSSSASSTSSGTSSSSGGMTDAYRDAVMNDGPVLYARLGETSGVGVFDEVSQSMVGTYAASGATLGAAGIVGSMGNTAVLFNDGRALIDDAGVLDFVGVAPYSIEAWVNATPDAMTNNYYGRVLAKEEYNGGSNRQGYNLLYERAPGDPNGSIITERWNVTGMGASHAPFKMNEGTYHHLVATFDGTTLKLYIDGAFVAQNTAVVPLVDLPDPLTVGSLPDTGSPFFGSIDEVAVYDKALMPTQIGTHFTVGSTP